MIEAFWEQNRSTITKQYFGACQQWSALAPSDDLLAGHGQSQCQSWVFKDLNAALKITVLSPHIIRVRVAPQGVFLPDFSYGLISWQAAQTHAVLIEEELSFIIKTSELSLVIRKADFHLSFFDTQGQLINEDAFRMHWEENVQSGGFNVYSSKKIQTEECFYGLGDKSCDLNLRGNRFTLWSTDAYAFERDTDPLYRNIPFYIGLHGGKGYGLFYDNCFKTYFDFGVYNSEEMNYWAEGGELNYYFIQGPHLMDVTKRYSLLTGTMPMPPLWALGFHQSRWSYFPEAKIKDLAKEFRERQIPCDVIHLDIDYMDGYRCFTWNEEHFPNPGQLAKEMTDSGFKLVTILDPGIKIDPNYDIYQEAEAGEYFCRRGDDYFMEGPVWPGRCRFPDFTNPKVRTWWGEHVGKLISQGISGVWNDMNEPSVFGLGTFPNDVRHFFEGYRGSHRKAHNVYGMQMARATYDGLLKHQPNKRPFTILRSTYAGGQRYGAAWTGDNIGTWDHLKLACVQCQRMSMSGFSFIGSDIGGFTGNADAELFVRWIQMATFHPLMRAHSSGDTIEREPWSYGPDAELIIKRYIELRYRLLPYLYSAFWENSCYGFPVLRPVVMLEQEKTHNTYRQDEFSFGDKILVCPVLQPGQTTRTVYLPKGKWYHFWTMEAYEGEAEHQVPCPLDEMPLFVKAGSVIPQYPVMQYVGEKELEDLELTVYYAEYAANSFLYEDHGDTLAYQQDIYTEKKFHYEYSVGKVTLTQTMQGLHTPRYEMYKITFTGLPSVPAKVILNGKKTLYFTSWQIECGLSSLMFHVAKSFQTLEFIW